MTDTPIFDALAAEYERDAAWPLSFPTWPVRRMLAAFKPALVIVGSFLILAAVLTVYGITR